MKAPALVGPAPAPDRASQARYLRARGRDYARHVVGGWYEVGSRSDGMRGRVDFENIETTEHVSYHWSVTSPHAQSEHEARQMAREDFENGVEG